MKEYYARSFWPQCRQAFRERKAGKRANIWTGLPKGLGRTRFTAGGVREVKTGRGSNHRVQIQKDCRGVPLYLS